MALKDQWLHLQTLNIFFLRNVSVLDIQRNKKKSNYSFEVYYVVKQLIGFPFVAPFMLIVKKNGI